MRAPTETVTRARRLRREMSLPEVLLWRDLRRAGLEGARFRRQHPIGRYVLDFYATEAKLAVEVDGAAHDAARDAWLSKRGVRVMRFNAGDVLDAARRDDVLRTIAAALIGPDG